MIPPTPRRLWAADCASSAAILSIRVRGAFDQRKLESRSDILVYSTTELQEDFEATGPVTVELYASSSAVDTDFTAKLVDVHPDGYAQNLAGGILRARYRDSPERAELMKPGEIYRFSIDLWATSNVFLKGHKVRLEFPAAISLALTGT